MDWIEVVGGNHLHGEVEIQGSKNAVLPILAACILNKGVSKINHCPRIKDVFHMLKILEGIGCKISFEHNTIVVDSSMLNTYVIAANYVGSMRSSIILLGSMIGRMKQVTIAYPGGCSIGARPIDLHFKALREMNIQIEEEDELICCKTTEIRGKHIELRFPSVGATENIILAAVLANGITSIQNAAREPEIVELCNFLRTMGAVIWGDGTDFITISGVTSLHDTEYTVTADRIVTGTYLAAVAAAGGTASLKSNCASQLGSVISLIQEIGSDISVKQDFITITSDGTKKAVPLLQTSPYPGFPTDMQSQIMAILINAKGTSTLVESIFESRYHNVVELRKMGACIETDDSIAVIKGRENIWAANVNAHDLRGGAALVIAGLFAKGKTRITGIEYIERGYEDICRDLKLLGVDIRKVHEDLEYPDE